MSHAVAQIFKTLTDNVLLGSESLLDPGYWTLVIGPCVPCVEKHIYLLMLNSDPRDRFACQFFKLILFLEYFLVIVLE